MDHTTRMILIPEELYLSLMTQRASAGGVLGEHLSSTINEMDKIRHTPSLNDEQKYALYNSQFKRLQNLKNETYERMPAANVNIKSVTPTATADVNIKSISDELATAITNVLNSIQQQSSEKQNHYSKSSRTTRSSLSSAKSYASKQGNEDEEDDNYEDAHDVQYKEEMITKTPSNQQRELRTKVLKPERAQVLEQKVEELTNIFMQNKAKYGIDNQGRILNDKNLPIKDSSIRQIAKRMLGAEDVTISPPGTRTLSVRLKNMPATQKLFEDAKQEIQSGKGKTYATTIKKQNISNRSLMFRPKLWSTLKKF